MATTPLNLATPYKDVVEILFIIIVIAALLALLRVLVNVGVLDPIPITEIDMPTLLIATSLAQDVRPETTSLMADVAMQVAKRGVEEAANPPTQSAARGNLIAIFPGRPSVSMCPTVSHHGVVIDAGEQRVTDEARSAWAVRLSADPSIRVSILPALSVTCVQTVERVGRLAALVARWRILRRLTRRSRGQFASSLIMVVSPRHRSVLFAAAHTSQNAASDLHPFPRDESPERRREAFLRRRHRQTT